MPVGLTSRALRRRATRRENTILNMYPESIWIIGAGRFGRLAANRLGTRCGREKLFIVDRDREVLSSLRAEGYCVERSDGVDFLVRHLAPSRGPAWIVPALPRHLAFEWLRRKLGNLVTPAPVEVPEALLKDIPVVIHGQEGAVYLSIACHRCPDDCPEPESYCTVTGRPRPLEICAYLEQQRQPGWNLVVVRSRQLAPGVGGFPPADLWAAAVQLAAGGPGLVATACRCHGVMHALNVRAPVDP
jgi:hypothetical protein